VAYIDPGNWATDLSAGANYGYKLLFIVLLAGLAACGKLQLSYFADHSVTIPLGPTWRDDNYLLTTSDAETYLGIEGEIPKIQNTPTWSAMVAVYPGRDCDHRYRSRRVVGHGHRIESVC